MKKHVTNKNITALTRLAVVCALALLVVGFSPAFAAALSRSADVGAMLSAMRSMIGPLGAIREWLPPFAGGARGSIDQIISQL
jgi:hypothetical protein